MALQDLTPQLRTRLSRVERTVGWFVFVATAVLVFGFAYYVYNTAQRKGWFIPKVNYVTGLNNAAGLKEGDPVKLMGFTVGEITRVEANGPYDYYSVTVFFQIKSPYHGYLWSDSTVKVAAADLLGNRQIEVTKGIAGVPTIYETTNKVAVGMLRRDYLFQQLAQRRKELKAQYELKKESKSLEDITTEALGDLNAEALEKPETFYTNLTAESFYFLDPEESPALAERLEKVVTQAEKALPNILNLTNKLAAVLDNSAMLTSNLNVAAENAQPLLANFQRISAQLEGPGALGDWLIPTNLNRSLEGSLAKVDSTMTTVDTNLPVMFAEVTDMVMNLADITSNLNVQVQANTNILSSVSQAVTDTDELVQGLKHHWLLRSAFKEKKSSSKKR